MTERILFVDDEQNILEGFQRTLRRSFQIEIESSGAAGLVALEKRGPFAVVVSDLRMPGMDGIQFLTTASERFPDTVRVLLTGDADLRNAIDAVNRGHLYRFLTKPCPQETLTATLTSAIEQYRLVTVERDLLDRTVRGAVRVLGEVLSLVNATAFGRADRARRLITEISQLLPEAKGWEIDVAATLSQLGCVVVPEKILVAAERNEPLSSSEKKMVVEHPKVARELLSSIPRMNQVAEIIFYQRQRYDGKEQDAPGAVGESIPFGARLLKVALDFEDLVSHHRTKPQAFRILESRTGYYDPRILKALDEIIRKEYPADRRDVVAKDLVPGMITADDLYNDAGALLLRRGSTLTSPLILRLQNSAAHGSLSKLIPALVPASIS